MSFGASGFETARWPCESCGEMVLKDARLCPPDQPNDGCLVLRGEIVQCSYPGGFYR